jgi:hypothetical protein
MAAFGGGSREKEEGASRGREEGALGGLSGGGRRPVWPREERKGRCCRERKEMRGREEEEGMRGRERRGLGFGGVRGARLRGEPGLVEERSSI